jgi:hypothetical protein
LPRIVLWLTVLRSATDCADRRRLREREEFQ